MDPELLKQIGSLTLGTAAIITTVVLWRKLSELQGKYEGLIDRYHTTITEMVKLHTQILDALEEAKK